MSEFVFDLQRFSVINNKKDSTLVSGSDSDDKITNTAANVTIAAGGGNDSVVNKEYADNMSISGGAGNDSIYNNGKYSSNTTITGNAGNDFILNNSYDVTIDGGAGNNSIQNKGENVSIVSGAGNDKISNSSDSVTIEAGDGKNSVVNSGSNVTISFGSGDDTIKNTGDNVYFQYESGNDKIIGFNATSSLQIGDGSATYTEAVSGNNIILTVGKEKITLQGAANIGNINVIGKKLDPQKIKLTDRADNYSNSQEGAIIDALAGNDSIYNDSDGSYSSILGGIGNDSITNVNGNKVSIEGDLGNDEIINGYWDGYSVHEGGWNVTINAGAGNDSIENIWGEYLRINAGDGNDYVFCEGNNSTVTGGKGNDYLHNGYNRGSNSSVNGGAGNDTILSDSNNNIISDVTLEGGAGNDFISIGSAENNIIKYSTGDGNDVIYGIDGNDTLQIGNGSENDAYSSTVKGDDVIVTVGNGKITLVGAANTGVNIAGVAVYKGHKYRVFNDNMTWEDAKAYCKKIGGHLVTITDKAENDFVYSLAKQGTEGHYWFGGYRDNNDMWQWVTKEKFSYSNWAEGEPNNDGGGENYIEMYGSVGAWNDKSSNDERSFICEWDNSKPGKSKSVTLTAGNDNYKNTVDGATISGLGGNDTITNSGAKVVFNYKSGEGNDKIIGFNATSTLKITSGTYSTTKSGSDIIVTVGKGKITLTGAASLSKVNISGKKKTEPVTTNSWKLSGTTAKYGTASKTLAQISGVKSTSGLSVSGNIITVPKNIIGNSKKVTVNGNGYEFDFNAGNILITGSKNVDSIANNGAKVTIGGGAGNDVISLGSSAANNVINYTSGDGKDIIYGVDSNDTIKIKSGKAKSSTSGNDVILTVGKGSITVKDAKNKTFTYSDAGGKHTYKAVVEKPYKVNSAGTAVTVFNAYSKEDFEVESEIAGGSKIVTINAAALTSGLNISGNDKANVILGGKGNDSIDGLSDNDTLSGGDGADIFLYYNGDGNDFITDYETKDIIQISSDDEIVTPTTKGRDIVLKVGNGSITLKNAAKNKIGVTYVENEVEHDYIKGEQTVVMEGKTATVSENYWKTTFDIANFGKGLQMVDASSVTHALKITGNNKANQILGGSGQNTLTGGKGNDTLQGGDKADVFIYNAGNAGDGNDVIYNYGKSDVISIVSGSVDSHTVKGDTVIFSIGNGKISVAGAAGKKITYYDENHSNGYSHIYPRGNSNVAEPLWFAEDDSDYELTPNLSSIVQNKAADCSFMNTSTKLSKENNLIAYAKEK